MKIFIVHRSQDKGAAKKRLKTISQKFSIGIKPVFLDSSNNTHWKQKAENHIFDAEAIAVYRPESCYKSDNAKWEIEKAKEAKKVIIELGSESDEEAAILKLTTLYHFSKDFEDCFSTEKKDTFDLYKMMVDSSEQLIQRRQKTNAFFITVIGSLLTIAGLLLKIEAVENASMGIVYGFAVIALLLCNSWRNLIDNYGKLNKAKFDVILRLEKDLNVQIYSAEWIALGKGLRPNKYKSFTSTEKNVPLFFALLIAILTIAIAIWQFWSQ
jgi:hypothetical protein